MENLFRKKLGAGTLAFMIIIGTLPLATGAQTATSTTSASCYQFQLNWTSNPPASASSTDVAGGKVSALFYPSDNPVRATTAPAVPTNLPAGTSAAWQCVSADATLGSAETQEEQDLGQGVALCAKAARLAAKFGGFTALNTSFTDKIQISVLNKVKDYLSKEFKNTTNIELDFNKIASSALAFAKNNLGINISVSNFGFDNLFDSSGLTKEVNGQIATITSGAKNLLSGITKDATKKALDAIGLGNLGGIGASEVPVKAQGVENKLDEVRRMQEQQEAQQRKSEVLADTRAKCAELLKTTNETIKRALLYQLSTQIVDWVQTGKTPQFIKQPGKFLEDTGRLALDRFISRVAPRLCEPFRLSVQLQIPSVRREDNPFYEQITCSLDRVVANMESFYQDFRQGGWIGYQEMLKPQNNYYGTSLAVMNEAMKQQAAVQAAALQAQTNGYSSVKECTEWAKFISYMGPTNNYVLDIRDDGNGNYFVRDSNADAEVTNGAGPLDSDGKAVSYLTQDPQTGRVEKGVRFWKNPYSPMVGSSYFWECEADEITQPANIAAGLAQKASQVDMDNLAASQDVSMFLQSIEDSIINKLTKSGVKGLQGLLKGLPIIP